MTYKDIYKEWINNPNLDMENKSILTTMNDNDIKEAFHKDLEFGTGGLRGLMGPGTNRINIYVVRKVTQGIANYLIANNTYTNGVAISYDNRLNSKVFALEVAGVFAANNIKSFLFNELRPTPVLSYAVRHFNADAGVMITASHNPKEYNGYKVYNKQGSQVNLDESNLIINSIAKVNDMFTIKSKTNSDLIKHIYEDFDEIYLNEVKSIRINQTNTSIKAVYSPLHGTGGTIIPKLAKQEGYDFHPLKSQMIVDPNFANTLSSNPEDDSAYIESIKYANEIGAEIVLLTDPDADRLGIAVKHNSEFVLINGNQTAALMVNYILDEKQKQNILPKNGVVYTTVVSTNLIKDIAESYHTKVISTLTGFKFIGEQAELNKDKYTYLFGSEESYGSLVSPFVRDKDAVQAVYLLLEIASVLKQSNLTIVDYLKNIYEKYFYYYESTKNITLSGIEGAKKINSIMDYVRNNNLEISNYQVLGKDDFLNKTYYEVPEVELPTSNVIKFHYNNGLIVIFRPSGTEPKLKIYYSIKSESNNSLDQLIDNIHKKIMKEIL